MKIKPQTNNKYQIIMHDVDTADNHVLQAMKQTKMLHCFMPSEMFTQYSRHILKNWYHWTTQKCSQRIINSTEEVLGIWSIWNIRTLNISYPNPKADTQQTMQSRL
jgi:hypothetical protein